MALPEETVEQYLIRRVKERGGLALKFTTPGRRGAPDRLVLIPGRGALLVELKAPGKKPDPHQRRYHEDIRAAGHAVAVADSKTAVDRLLNHKEETP